MHTYFYMETKKKTPSKLLPIFNIILLRKSNYVTEPNTI